MSLAAQVILIKFAKITMNVSLCSDIVAVWFVQLKAVINDEFYFYVSYAFLN